MTLEEKHEEAIKLLEAFKDHVIGLERQLQLSRELNSLYEGKINILEIEIAHKKMTIDLLKTFPRATFFDPWRWF